MGADVAPFYASRRTTSRGAPHIVDVTASRLHGDGVGTTVAIDDDVLEHARVLARDRGMSLGAAVSELMRRGIRGTPEPRGEWEGPSFPTFEVRDGAPTLTLERVKRALEDEL